MIALAASEARANLYRLIDQAAESHEPILISGKRAKAVLLSEEDWAAVQETLHLLSVPKPGQFMNCTHPRLSIDPTADSPQLVVYRYDAPSANPLWNQYPARIHQGWHGRGHRFELHGTRLVT